ncbi:family 16 glycosylhydrolase [Paracraurococcus lichenis]|uniref:Carbohydrate-binding domain-containing protein n=1 Tax=Paracraurococcus lichenis TaxID=3064888 RepID=A0ABT9E9E1_9PROT|nr:carbohydrate-binding domain-containing protein [Paracraurococcus sp. LOR1-02]MDO9712821.1 carbohydrate-binding domain-containing protein [Paracraurococcus sp. LOR1-02]
MTTPAVAASAILQPLDPPAGTRVVGVGTGPNTLDLHVSGTPYAGLMPQFTVSVDGVQMGGVFTVSSLHGQASDAIALHGTWGPGAHVVSINYLNDDFNRAADWSNPAAVMAVSGNDRNLFIDDASYDGQAIPGAARGIWNAAYKWGDFTTASAPTGTTAAVGTTVAPDATAQANSLTDKAGSGAFDTTDAALAQYGITQQDLAAYQQQANEALAGTGLNPDIYAMGKPVSGSAPAVVDDRTLDFNGGHYDIRYVEDFGNGRGLFTNAWGDAGVANGVGYSAVRTDDGFSGLMIPANGPSGGLSYGLHVLFGSLTPAWHSGTYFCLWPADDKWPGPEIDLVEINGAGQPYGTLHWAKNGVAGDGGFDNNGYDSFVYTGVDASQPHAYWVDWQRDHITFGVDDHAFRTFTTHVPQAYVDGGTNQSPGIGSKFEGVANTGTLQGYVYATESTTGGFSAAQLTGALDHPLI